MAAPLSQEEIDSFDLGFLETARECINSLGPQPAEITPDYINWAMQQVVEPIPGIHLPISVVAAPITAEEMTFLDAKMGEFAPSNAQIITGQPAQRPQQTNAPQWYLSGAQRPLTDCCGNELESYQCSDGHWRILQGEELESARRRTTNLQAPVRSRARAAIPRSTAFEAPVHQTATLQSPVHQVAALETPVYQTAAVQSPVRQTMDIQPPVNQFAAFETSVYQNATIQSPVYQTMDIQSPVYQTMDIQSPVYQTMDVQSPVYQTMDIQSPVYQTTDVQSPVYQTTDVQSPVYQTTDVQSPVHQFAALEDPALQTATLQTPVANGQFGNVSAQTAHFQ
ncbi:hypothetical protein MKX08_005281 [Trichoderma sp. CBMAI-0020]|nr:hypothetical protein MKX08_005281 [Trichoderma sp. CBMAI-0020]